MAAGSIVIDLLMKTGSFETDTKRAEKRLQELKKEATLAGAAIGAAFTAVSTAAAFMVKSSIDAMDDMSKMAQKAGTSVESLSALSYAADLSGVSHEALGSAMVKLSKNMSDAAMGTGEAEKGFKALGISVKNADGTLKSTDQMLAEVADKFAGYKDGAEKTALAVAIFGKAGADLIPLLNGGSAGLAEMRDEAQRLGVVLDTETSELAEEFNDNLSRMGAAVQGVTNKAATELLPALKDVSTMFADLAKNQAAVDTATGIVQTSVSALITIFQTAAVVGSDVGFVFQSIGREIGALAAQAAALGVGFEDMLGGPASIAAAMAKAAISGELSFQRFSAISDAVKADGERARAELDKFQQRVMALGSGSQKYQDPRILGPVGSIASQVGGMSAPGITDKGSKKDPDADFKAYMRNLEQQIQKTQELTSAEKVLDDVRRGTLTVTDSQKQQLLVLAGQIDADKERTEQIKLRREAVIAEGDAVNKANEEYQKLIKSLLDGGPLAQLEKQRKTMLDLAEALNTKAITPEQFNDAATGFLGLDKKLEDSKKGAQEFGAAFSNAFEEAILRGKDLGEVLEGLAVSIASIAIQKAITIPLGNALGGSLASLFGGFFADGGSPPMGKVSVVGERGPEFFVPRTAGTVIPNEALGGSRQTIHQNFYMTVGDVADMGRVRDEIRASQRQLIAGLDRAQRYGR